ncbi:MAG TPA: AAA family ATPase, partial [bacterium]|nr:AAA family ATPase [bacterium]
NGVATLSGLPSVQLEELVTFPNGVQGMVLNLDRKHVDVILLGPDQGIRGGDLTLATGKRLSVPVGMQFLGRVIGPLGRPQDELGPIVPSEYRFIERIAPGVIERAPVNEPLYSGTKIIDALIPLGRGQRELILGDRQTGKTTLALDTILSQRGTDVKCIYVAISQKKTSVINAINILKKGGVLGQTTVIIASPDDPPALRYLAPYVGVTLAEFLLDERAMVRVDMSEYMERHAVSRLIGAPPGYVGYDEGGQLTEAVRRRPYAVVLLDEIEKAHPEVFNVLLQVLDEGRLTDNQGRTVNFRNTIVIMTSNLGAQQIMERSQEISEKNRKKIHEEVREEVLGLLKNTLRPEFLNRIDDVIVFHALRREEIKQIARLQMKQLQRLLERQELQLEVTPEVEEYLAEHGYDPAFGARPLKRLIQREMADALAIRLLEGDFPAGSTVQVVVRDKKLDFIRKSV